MMRTYKPAMLTKHNLATAPLLPNYALITYPRSPLRYPGGKSRAVNKILPLIPDKVELLCSPFIGGGSFELACAAKGIKVCGYDIFSPLVHFWQCTLENPTRLASLVENYYPLTKQEFYSLQKSHLDLANTWSTAAVFFVLNRSSFSGVTFSGGMSPGHKRFTRSAIQRLRDFIVDNLTVEEADYETSINANKDAFLYLDPPYLNGQKLYGVKGSAHEGFDHFTLYKLLKKRDSWILSYNDCQTIREWYKDYKIISADWRYGMGNNKKSNEILVLSKDIENPK